MTASRPHRICLTGSIGMGKSTVAGFFADAGVPVWDADQAVHRLYAANGKGAQAISEICPDAVGADGVDRKQLKARIAEDTSLLKRIEAAIHPLVAADREDFAEAHRSDILLFDIPLLFETGDPGQYDTVIVVSADPETQKQRVLDRPGMTERDFEMIKARQMPDAEKRKRADIVIDTTQTLEDTRQVVIDIVKAIKAGTEDA